MSRILIIPGLAVRGYATSAAAALTGAGHDATLLDPPGWPGRPPDLRRYGHAVADEITASGVPVDLLIGLSVGGQAAAVTAVHQPRVQQLLLISPTIDPEQRSRRRLLVGWLRGENHPDSPNLRQQLPDWRRAGAVRLYQTFVSVLSTPVEELLPSVTIPTTIVHADHDRLSAHAYAAQLADIGQHRLLIMPDAPHSWPIGDSAGFIKLVDQLLAHPPRTEVRRPG